MTPEQIKLVQQSFNKTVPITEKVAKKFLTMLFAIDPKLKPLFADDPKGKRLMATFTTFVKGLSKMDSINGIAQQMGVRFKRMGIRMDDYMTIGAALIETLAFFQKDDFTPSIRQAWIEGYGVIASIMIRAANEQSI